MLKLDAAPVYGTYILHYALLGVQHWDLAVIKMKIFKVY